MNNTDMSTNTLYTLFNLLGVATAYVMLSLSIYWAPVDFSTKGFWGIGIFLLTLSLVNLVKYRFDASKSQDRIKQLEDAKNEKLLQEFVQTDGS